MKSNLLFCALILLFSPKLGLAAASDGCPGGLEMNEDGSCGGGTEPGTSEPTAPNLDLGTDTKKELDETDGDGCPGGLERNEDGSCGGGTEPSASEPTVPSMDPTKELEENDGGSANKVDCGPGWIPHGVICVKARSSTIQISLETETTKDGSISSFSIGSTIPHSSIQISPSSTMPTSGSSSVTSTSSSTTSDSSSSSLPTTPSTTGATPSTAASSSVRSTSISTLAQSSSEQSFSESTTTPTEATESTTGTSHQTDASTKSVSEAQEVTTISTPATRGSTSSTSPSTSTTTGKTPVALTSQEAAWLEGLLEMGSFVEDNVSFYVCQDTIMPTTTTPKPTFASTFLTKKTTASTSMQSLSGTSATSTTGSTVSTTESSASPPSVSSPATSPTSDSSSTSSLSTASTDFASSSTGTSLASTDTTPKSTFASTFFTEKTTGSSSSQSPSGPSTPSATGSTGSSTVQPSSSSSIPSTASSSTLDSSTSSTPDGSISLSTLESSSPASSTTSQSSSSETTTSPAQSTKSMTLKTLLGSTTTSSPSTSSETSSPSTSSSIGTSTFSTLTGQPSSSPVTTESTMPSMSQTSSSPTSPSSTTSSSPSSSMRTTTTSTGSTGSLPISSKSSLESTKDMVSTGLPTNELSTTTEQVASQTSSSSSSDMTSSWSSSVSKETTNASSGSPKTSSVTSESPSVSTDSSSGSIRFLTDSTESVPVTTQSLPYSTGIVAESTETPLQSSLLSSTSSLPTMETSSDRSTIVQSSFESLEASSVDSLLISSGGTSTMSGSPSATSEETSDGYTELSNQVTETSMEVNTEESSARSSISEQSTTVALDKTTSSRTDRMSSPTEAMAASSVDQTGVSTEGSTMPSGPSGSSWTVTSEVTTASSTVGTTSSIATETPESQSTMRHSQSSEASSTTMESSSGTITITSSSQQPVEMTSTNTVKSTLEATTTGTETKAPSTTASPSGTSKMMEQGSTTLESSTVITSTSKSSSTAGRSSEAPSSPLSAMSGSTTESSTFSVPPSTKAATITTLSSSSGSPTNSDTTSQTRPIVSADQRSSSTIEAGEDTKTPSSELSSTTKSLAPSTESVPSSTRTPPSLTKSTEPSSTRTITSSSVGSTSTIPTTSTPSTTTDPTCSRQCPDGYLIGASSCFLLIPASSKVNSYQTSLSYCKTTALQTLASLDKIKSNADIKLIQEKAALLGVDWIFANGIGGQQERFRKSASVYSIFSQSLTVSPIVKTVGISDVFGNVSALCVLPQYCNKNECDVQKLFLAYGFFSSFTTSSGTLEPQAKGSVTCLYGNKKTVPVTCNTLGTIYPNPTIIDCQEGLTERPLKDTTNETVSSCKVCFGRGTKACQSVLNDNGEVEGYRCVCKEPYYMSRCWKTVNPCSPTACGPNGVCHNEIGEMKCSCNWGYSGDKCEKNLKDEFFKKATYSTTSGATITFGEFILKVLKSCILGLSLAGNQGNDIQDTHQYFRTFCTVAAGVILTMWSNPTVWGINQAACRYYFILIHFFYMLAMIQWILEAINVNQVLRAIHSNTWEVDNRRRRSWGVRVMVRLAMPTVALAVFLLIVFQTGWFKLAATWTCVGVICQDNLSVWIPVFFFVIILTLSAAAVYETSLKIQRGRPLIRYLIDFMVERQFNPVEGQRVNKCRDNSFLSFVGLLLLINQWIAVILSSDYRDSKIFGVFAVLSSGAYSLFCSYQDIWTNPEERGNYLQLMQRFFPRQFAPDYNPETTWTFDEVRAHFALPKAERDQIYESFLSRNQQLQCHHRWDLRLNEILAEDQEITVNLALCKVFCEEMNRLKARRGTNKQKEVIKEVYAAYMHSVPHVNPREAGRLRGRLELVTLAAEDDTYPGGVRMARFFIVPRFHIFEPEIPERGDSTANLRSRNHQRRLLQQLEADIYELAREEALSQRTFMNSTIQFMNYGNKVVR